ncbi:YqzG/YhdC family protein [Neobacillus mesonae]|nr:YqzG/YhdC family protein [Neobacillus mesonae]
MKLIWSHRRAPLMLVSLFILGLSYLLSTADSVYAIEPEYAKWGNIAVLEAKEQYSAPVTDYQHLGRTVISEQIAEEKFRLIIKKAGREFPVTVIVRFNPRINELIDVQFRE